MQRPGHGRILAALALFAAAPALAQGKPGDAAVGGYQSARALTGLCTDTSSYGQSYCYAYIAAAADTVRAYQAWMGLNDVCLPARVSQGQLRDIFVDYARAHPESGDDQAASIVVLALGEKFPCAAARAPRKR